MVLLSDAEEVLTDEEMRDYARGREKSLRGHREPSMSNMWEWLGWIDVVDGVSVSERIEATRNGEAI